MVMVGVGQLVVRLNQAFDTDQLKNNSEATFVILLQRWTCTSYGQKTTTRRDILINFSRKINHKVFSGKLTIPNTVHALSIPPILASTVEMLVAAAPLTSMPKSPESRPSKILLNIPLTQRRQFYTGVIHENIVHDDFVTHIR